MAAQFKVYVDWLNDGDFTDAGDDVTGRTLDGRTPITIRYGRDQARALSPIAVGEAHYELDNTSRDYSPDNTGSPLNGLVQPGRPTLIQATVSGTTYTLFNGQFDDFTVQPDVEQHSIDVTCLDALAKLKGVLVSTELYSGLRTGDAVNYLLDAAGWPTSLRDIDAGASYLPWWWLDGDDAYDALLQLVDSEGPAALVTVDTTGRIVFRDRHHRLLRSASTTVQSTWRSGGDIEPVVTAPADYNHGWKEIINSVSFDVPNRRLDATTAVWNQDDQISIADGDTAQITASGTSAFTAALVPVQDTDFTVTGTVSVALSRTSGGSTTILITASGGPAVVTGLQLRAKPLDTVSTATVTVEDPASIAQFGRRSLPDARTPVWASRYDAQAIGELIVGRRGQRVPTITVSMVGTDPARLGQQLNRDLSDRVHMIETHTGLDADCHIEQITHTVTEGGLDFRTTFGLEKVAAPVAAPITFDVAGRGFDQGTFGQIGLDNGSQIFLFDVSGQGFDQGLFAT